MAALTYLGPSDGYNQSSIQDAFHFDTNQFLIPIEGECAPLDYDDLFSMLNQPAAQGSWESSGAKLPVQSAGSEGGVVSPEWPQAASVLPRQFAVELQPQEQEQRQQSEVKPLKALRDNIPKRARDGARSKTKQNQVKELEALAAKKSEDLERLLQENSELKFRSQILEKVVQMRDYQLKIMKGVPPDLPQFLGFRLQPGPGGDAAAASPRVAPSATAAAPAAAAAAAAGQPWECEKGVAATNCGKWKCPNAAASSDTHGSQSAIAAVKMAGCGCLLSASEGPLTAEDRERFRSLGKRQLMEGWKHFLSEVAVPMLALESNGQDEQAAVRIRQLAAEAVYMFKHASLLAPDTMMVASQTHLETESLAAAEPGHWRNVVSKLELSEEQVRELHAVFRLFNGIMFGVLAERRTINQRLADGSHGSAVDISVAMEQLTVSPECDVLQALQRSLRREKAAHLLLRGFLFGRTLSVLQFVKAAVYSYPWIPNATAIVATVVEGSSDA